MEVANRGRWLVIEFTVIVLGILSALIVDTWIDERKDAELAADYKSRMLSDLQSDIDKIDAVSSYYQRIRQFGLVTLSDLEGKRELSDFFLLFAAFNAAEEWRISLDASTFQDMQNTGRLALIDDVQVRLLLADYHRVAALRGDVWNLPRPYREQARGIIPNALQAAIHERCTAIPDSVLSGVLAASSQEPLPAWEPGLQLSAGAGFELENDEEICGIQADEFDLAVAATQFRTDPALERTLRFRMSEIRVSINLLAGQRELAKELIARLKS